MKLAGKDFRLGPGDHTIPVGVATPHCLIEFFVPAGFDRVIVVEDNRNGNPPGLALAQHLPFLPHHCQE
jgi:hypothetical protein